MNQWSSFLQCVLTIDRLPWRGRVQVCRHRHEASGASSTATPDVVYAFTDVLCIIRMVCSQKNADVSNCNTDSNTSDPKTLENRIPFPQKSPTHQMSYILEPTKRSTSVLHPGLLLVELQCATGAQYIWETGTS